MKCIALLRPGRRSRAVSLQTYRSMTAFRLPPCVGSTSAAACLRRPSGPLRRFHGRRCLPAWTLQPVASVPRSPLSPVETLPAPRRRFDWTRARPRRAAPGADALRSARLRSVAASLPVWCPGNTPDLRPPAGSSTATASAFLRAAPAAAASAPPSVRPPLVTFSRGLPETPRTLRPPLPRSTAPDTDARTRLGTSTPRHASTTPARQRLRAQTKTRVVSRSRPRPGPRKTPETGLWKSQSLVVPSDGPSAFPQAGPRGRVGEKPVSRLSPPTALRLSPSPAPERPGEKPVFWLSPPTALRLSPRPPRLLPVARLPSMARSG